MSIIQNIREKAALFSAIAIGLALLGFVMMDAFSGKSGGMFNSGRSTTLGSVNGTDIDATGFARKVSLQEENARTNGQPLNENQKQGLIEQLWDQEVNTIIMNEEYDKLGMDIGKKELNDLMYQNFSPVIMQMAANPQTGEIDQAQIRTAIEGMKRNKDEKVKAQFISLVDAVVAERKQTKYTSMLSGSVYYPKWIVEKQNNESAGLANISYVTVPYTTIADSTIKVSNDEINTYINSHKDQFKQEESRGISYMVFDAAPTAADSAAIRDKMMPLKTEFENTADVEGFLSKEFNSNPYYNSYIHGKNLQVPNKEEIMNTPVGQVYGPYVDGDQYALAKVVAERTLPDTVSVRHILIATHQQTQDRQLQRVREDNAAKQIADSVENLIKNGMPFDTALAKFSEDPGSKEKGGLYEKVTTGGMVASFNDFIFTNPAGSKGIVKTEFGYHYIEILSQKGASPAYKIAYLTKPIEASEETSNAANTGANMFAGDSRDLKLFDTNASKLATQGINKQIAQNITPNAYYISGINGNARQLIKEIYDADKGDVLEPRQIGDKYIVAAVTDVFKEGVMDANIARPRVEGTLITKKKAEELIKKIGTPSSLQDVATKMTGSIQVADSLRFVGQSKNLGFEQKVIGAAFNPANKDKAAVGPIPGSTGVYVIKVDEVMATSAPAGDMQQQRDFMRMQAIQRMSGPQNPYGYGQQQPYNPATVLKKAASVKDMRSKFY